MKLKMLLCAFGALLLLLSGMVKSQDNIIEGYRVSICNICDTNQLFQAYAQSLDVGNHIIINLETQEARAYNIMLGDSKDGSDGVFKRIGFAPMPSEVSNILNELTEMEASFEAILESMIADR